MSAMLCKSWCGTATEPAAQEHARGRDGVWLCTAACYDAGRAVSPKNDDYDRGVLDERECLLKAIRGTVAINRGQSSEVILAGFSTLADELERAASALETCGGRCQYCSTLCVGPYVGHPPGRSITDVPA